MLAKRALEFLHLSHFSKEDARVSCGRGSSLVLPFAINYGLRQQSAGRQPYAATALWLCWPEEALDERLILTADRKRLMTASAP